MSRHSKNAHLRGFFTPGERAKLKGVGTQSARLTSDSQRQLDMCCLCLAPLLHPVATPSGALYCKECILQYMVAQRAAAAEAAVVYEAAVAAAQAAQAAAAEEERLRQLAVYDTVSTGLSATASATTAAATTGASASSSASGSGSAATAAQAAVNGSGLPPPKEKLDSRDAATKRTEIARASFWLVPDGPSNAAPGTLALAAAATAAATGTSAGSGSSSSSSGGAGASGVKLPPKPDGVIRDPVGGAPLKAKQLLPVVFTFNKDGGADEAAMQELAVAKEGGGSRQHARYKCPACDKPLLYQATFAMRRCGHVLCGDCTRRLVLPARSCYVCSEAVDTGNPAITQAAAADGSGGSSGGSSGARGGRPLEELPGLLKLQVGGSGFAAHAGTQAEAKSYKPAMLV